MSATGEVLTSSTATAASYAYSDQSSSGFISIEVTGVGGEFDFGLTDVAATDAPIYGSANNAYFFIPFGGNMYGFCEHGTCIANSSLPFAYNASTVFKVQSDGTTVTAWEDATLVYTAIASSVGLTLFPEASGGGQSGTLNSTAVVTGVDPGVGSDGDFDLDTFLFNLYHKVAGSWVSLGSIKGPTGGSGASGATGQTGPTGGAVSVFSLSTGTLSGLSANEIVGNGKVPVATTITYAVAAANTFSCVSNPTLKLWDCGTSAGACTSGRTEMAAITLTAANTQIDASSISISSPSIAAGHYWAWELDSGTCASLNATGTAQ